MSLETLKPNLEQKKTKEQKLPIPSKEALEAIRKAQEAKKIPVIGLGEKNSEGEYDEMAADLDVEHTPTPNAQAVEDNQKES